MIFSQVKLANSTTGSYTGWTNVANITADDGVLAVSSVVGHNSNTPYLKLSDFQFEIPEEATVVGVVCRVEGKNEIAYNTGFFAVGAGNGNSGGIQLRGVTGAIGKGMTAFTANTLATKIVGGDADLWGATEISPIQTNNAAFGVYALFRNGNVTPQKMSIDKIELEVFYTMPEPDPSTGGGSLPPKNL
jgi:hypothetical protein